MVIYFQMSTHVNIELNTLDYKKLSDPFEVFSYRFNSPLVDGLPHYLDQTANQNVIATDTGQVTAVVYWFELYLTPSKKIVTLDANMHWRQAAVMQKNTLTVSTGSTVSVKAKCKSSCVDIKVSLNK